MLPMSSHTEKLVTLCASCDVQKQRSKISTELCVEQLCVGSLLLRTKSVCSVMVFKSLQTKKQFFFVWSNSPYVDMQDVKLIEFVWVSVINHRLLQVFLKAFPDSFILCLILAYSLEVTLEIIAVHKKFGSVLARVRLIDRLDLRGSGQG